jgi:hypothetical protein
MFVFVGTGSDCIFVQYCATRKGISKFFCGAVRSARLQLFALRHAAHLQAVPIEHLTVLLL